MFESIAATERKGDWEREVATTRYMKSIYSEFSWLAGLGFRVVIRG